MKYEKKSLVRVKRKAVRTMDGGPNERSGGDWKSAGSESLVGVCLGPQAGAKGDRQGIFALIIMNAPRKGSSRPQGEKRHCTSVQLSSKYRSRMGVRPCTRSPGLQFSPTGTCLSFLFIPGRQLSNCCEWVNSVGPHSEDFRQAFLEQLN